VDGPKALLTGYTEVTMDLRENVEQAYNTLWEISPELADASLSFRTDEGDIVDFQAPAWGTASLLNQIAVAPFRGVDTSYAERFDIEKGLIESDYLFRYVPSWGDTSVLPGPDDTYYLHWVIEMDPQSIAMVHDQDKDRFGAMFILTAEIVSRGDPNKILVNLRNESFMNLTDSQAEPQLRLPFAYSGMFPIIGGSYNTRIILRNRACASRDESSCLKSYTILESLVEVPERDTVTPRLGEVVLAYGTEWHSDKPLYRPYRMGGRQILPNPRRVYAIGDSLVAMTEPLDAEPGSKVRFRIVGRDTPDQVHLERSVTVEKFRLEPLVQELELQGFPAGHYRLVADLLDPSDNTVIDNQTSDFDVTPRTAVPRPSVRGSWLQVVPEVPGLVKMALGEQYLNLEDKETARKHFEASVAANPRLCPACVSLGALLLEEGDVEGVIEILEPECSDEDRYEPLALLGEAYFRKQDYAKASELLEKAFAIRRSDTRLLNSLAVSLYHLGNPRRARELLERSLSLNPAQPAIKELLDKIKSG
jgi:thioredoxin-like negative regulator of GroEL